MEFQLSSSRFFHGSLRPESSKLQSYHTHEPLSIPFPTVCFNSHLTMAKRAVEGYNMLYHWRATSRVYPPLPLLVPTKQAGDMWGRSSLLLLLIFCSLTLHKWTNVFVCCFMRSHILIPSEHCHSLSPLVLYFEVLHSSPTASPGQHSCTRPGFYRAQKEQRSG